MKMVPTITKIAVKALRCSFIGIVLPALVAGCSKVTAPDHDIIPKRLTVRSPWFYVSEDDIDLQESYVGFDPNTQRRFSHLTIGDKAIQMINQADKVILASAFLFDVLYVDQDPQRDIVNEISNAIIAKKKANPEIAVVVVLDNINRAYGRRIGPTVERLLDNGVDFFYSDTVSTRSATFFGIGQFLRDTLRLMDNMSSGILGEILSIPASMRIPVPNPLDEDGLSIEGLWNILALKANHRKLLVTDSADTFEAMITSGNPHNASVPFINYSVTAKGDVAKYIYMVIREDVIYSKDLDMVDWSENSQDYQNRFLTDVLPPIPPSDPNALSPSASRQVAISFVTESRIRDSIIEMLSSANDDDEVRIQMFYLSEYKVIDAIIDAAKRLKKPVRIILDINANAFGSKKDGAPNRQVAAHLMKKKKQLGLNLEIRWYETDRQQNHAKIMSITNPNAQKPKYELINGSANWTGKNLKDINLEADICVKGSEKVVSKFNKIFDMLWNNSDRMVYTVPYEGKYEPHSGMHNWRLGENWGLVHW